MHTKVFFNTRPVDRGVALTDYLSDAAMQVITLPLLEMQPLDKLKSAAWLDDMCAGEYDVLVVVSPTAAEYGIEQLQKCDYPQVDDINVTDVQQARDAIKPNMVSVSKLPKTVIAVGSATAAVLNKYGIKAVLPEQMNNESMLIMPEISQLTSNNKVMIWRGQGGRRLLIDSLKERSVQVDVVELYTRCFPQKTINLYQNWLLKRAPCLLQACREVDLNITPLLATVLISSGESWQNWQQLLLKSADISEINLANFHYLVLGERLTNIFSNTQLSYQTIDNLEPAHILQTLNNRE